MRNKTASDAPPHAAIQQLTRSPRLAVRCDRLDSTDSADESPGVGHFAAFRAGILNFRLTDGPLTIRR